MPYMILAQKATGKFQQIDQAHNTPTARQVGQREANSRGVPVVAVLRGTSKGFRFEPSK